MLESGTVGEGRSLPNGAQAVAKSVLIPLCRINSCCQYGKRHECDILQKYIGVEKIDAKKRLWFNRAALCEG